MVPVKILWICFWPSNRSYQVPEEEFYVSCAHMVHGGEGKRAVSLCWNNGQGVET